MRSPGYLDLKRKGPSSEPEQCGKTWIGMEEATIDSETIDLEADNGFCGERGWRRVSHEHLFRAHLASVFHSVAVTILNPTDDNIWPAVL